LQICFAAAVVSRVKDETMCLAMINPCGDAGAPDGEIGTAFQAFHRDHLGLVGKA
jgi:hypothetical protein